MHKLTFPLPFMVWAGFVMIFVILVLANAGGIGGGGILNTFILIFFSLPIKEVVPLGNTLGLTAALVRFILNRNQRHPTKPHCLTINYDLIEISANPVFAGSLIGVYLNGILPDLVIAFLLGTVLLIMSAQTF